MANQRGNTAAAAPPLGPEVCYDVVVNILGLRESDGWSAVALEMDLWGHGASFEDAVHDLQDLVRMQISFAHFKGQPDMIWKSAEPIWFQRFAEVRRERMEALVREQEPDSADFNVAGLPILAPLAGSAFEALRS